MEPNENPAHPEEEDPEEHMGDVMKDPWDDPNQTDWPTNADHMNDTSEEVI